MLKVYNQDYKTQALDTTTDVNEIELIVDAINDIKCTQYHNYWGSNDGVYMSVYMNGKCELYFDVSVGKCKYGDCPYCSSRDR